MAVHRSIVMDRENPSDLRELARALALASGHRWEILPIVEACVWVHRAAALADALIEGRLRGPAC